MEKSHDEGLSRATIVSMVPYWPLFDLRLETSRLVLRPNRDDDFPGLLEPIDVGIHDPEAMPFSQPWTDVEPTLRNRKCNLSA